MTESEIRGSDFKGLLYEMNSCDKLYCSLKYYRNGNKKLLQVSKNRYGGMYHIYLAICRTGSSEVSSPIDRDAPDIHLKVYSSQTFKLPN